MQRLGAVVRRVLPRSAVVRCAVLDGRVWGVQAGPVAQRQWLHVAALQHKSVPFLLADIGEGITEAQLLQWHVKPGDVVAQFDAICDVQSDKATVDITSRYDGKVVKLYYKEGEVAKVGAPLVDIEVEDSAPAGTLSSPTPVPVESAGQILTDPEATAKSLAAENGGDAAKALMTPAVRRLLREHNLSVTDVRGTGKNGRVLKEDVLAHVENKPSGGRAAAAPAASRPAATPAAPTPASAPARSAPVTRPPAAAPAPQALTEDVVEPITGIRASMVKSMNAALKVPHFGYCDEIEMDSLIAVRDALKEEALAHNIKLSYMPFILKATSLALYKYPIINSHVDAEGKTLTKKAQHNIGVAMDTPQGLLVPNVKDVGNKSILEIAAELNRLQAAGAAGKLSKNDLTGGTFSISNIGIIGGTYLSPVLVVPEVAIAAIGKIRRLPRFDDEDNVIPVSIMEISFSADHRVLDGATIAKFSNEMKRYLEQPISMMTSLR